MSIKLDGILDHDVIISMIDNSRDSIWIYTENAQCVADLKELPFHVSNTAKGVYCMFPPVDPIALAERIAITWETAGLKVERRVLCSSKERYLQSFVLLGMQ